MVGILIAAGGQHKKSIRAERRMPVLQNTPICRIKVYTCIHDRTFRFIYLDWTRMVMKIIILGLGVIGTTYGDAFRKAGLETGHFISAGKKK